MCRILKVTGDSLSPLFEEGDFVFTIKIPFFNVFNCNILRQGDIIIISHPYYGRLIKMIKWLTPDGNQIYVIGTNPNSTDSRTFGLVERKWVQGKVFWQIRKPRTKGNDP